jgi:hypothetical protein
MVNRDYCRFQNTLEDLKDCQYVIQGGDENYQHVSDLSPDEFQAMNILIDTCKCIVNSYNNGNEFFG